MGFFDFVKEAGEKLFHARDTETASAAVASAPDDEEAKARLEELNRTAADAIEAYINTQGLSVTGLTVTFDGASGVATVFGVAGDQASKEKVLLCCGNVTGVSQVSDMMSVDQSEPEATFYTVVSGDNLSKVAQQQYGSASKYMLIFEANKPMLSHPDKIYPGQVLRIPPQ
ncbi:MAG: peptidoglycan-binding protein LysM [Candidatus Accumulibacter sp.]|jgi:nucleoid-associated protein YgaU|uniref:Potassium binding protein Kbp n=1 Tax=Candidatus Accumulibacter affinis TaxID=2954384 RepID=A0A935W316_9PROT|nr:peptidoglycan-binding protein LysM [Candidatus Accumulibacter affinis]